MSVHARRTPCRSFLFVIPLLLTLTGCNTLPTTDDSADPDSAISTDDPSELIVLAEAAYDAQDWPTAERYYAKLTDVLSREVEPWFRLGNVYARMNQPEPAIAAYKEALIRDPNLSKAWHNMGAVHLRQAANSFLQLRTYTEEGTPTRERADAMYDAIIGILQGGTE